MFENKKKENSEAVLGTINLIGQGTQIVGDITCKGDIRIDGSIKGKVISKAKVVIGTTGGVEGSVSCQNADISGNMEGEVKVSELLFLKSTSKLFGEIVTNKLVVEAGAVFTGHCNMGVTASPTNEKSGKGHGERESKQEKVLN